MTHASLQPQLKLIRLIRFTKVLKQINVHNNVLRVSQMLWLFLVFAHVVERKHEWKNYEATLTGQRSIHVRDVLTEIDETLDFNRDRVVEMALGYGYLVVSTTTQIYVYNVANFNTPYIFDSPETVSFIQLAEKFFLVLTPAAVAVYTYDGRKVSTPRFAGLRADRLSAPVLSLSPDLVAVVDSTDRRTVRLCDVMTGKPREPAVKHTADVAAVQLNQTPARQTHERQLLLVDRNDELWLYLCGTAEGHKLHTQVDSACWNETSEALCAIADGRLLVWGYPRVAFTDRDLLPGTLTTKDGAEFGQLAQVASFRGTKIVVRRADGAQVTATVAPYSDMLHEYGSQHRWDEAVGVCRFVEDRGCWCALASMALEASNLDVAEISLAALREVDKLQYILYVKSIPSAEARNAELALYKRRPDDAERILLQATPPLVYRAIKMRIRAFQWDKALDLAVKHRSHVEELEGKVQLLQTSEERAVAAKMKLASSMQVEEREAADLRRQLDEAARETDAMIERIGAAADLKMQPGFWKEPRARKTKARS